MTLKGSTRGKGSDWNPVLARDLDDPLNVGGARGWQGTSGGERKGCELEALTSALMHGYMVKTSPLGPDNDIWPMFLVVAPGTSRRAGENLGSASELGGKKSSSTEFADATH
jgi:hypothetical protein